MDAVQIDNVESSDNDNSHSLEIEYLIEYCLIRLT